jgi:type I site-specific restriction endonuclease
MGEEKTLIFCATDAHADMVKRLLDEAFAELYGAQYNEAAVRKITGAADKVDTLIRRYKNERLPSIAITVDLLTTGIDVPAICHLVFMRRVRSRILYEQMIGRATRRCDDIGKTVFKIYDPVDLYAGAAGGQHHAAAGQGPQGHARTTDRRAEQPGQPAGARQPCPAPATRTMCSTSSTRS